MAVPFFKEMKIGAYLVKQKLMGRKRYPLVLMLEPLFRCNLACAGCGKIDYPDPILNRRLSVQECLDAVDECGAPMVAIPGGEPLIHKDIGAIVYYLKAVPWQVADFNVSTYKDRLERVHEFIQNHGGFEVHAHRHLIVATKPGRPHEYVD